MNEIRQRIKALRLELLSRNLDAWFISGTDPHGSEYLPERWQTRAFISGFTGSSGIVVITQEEAGLWTDSRYFIQGENQLKGSGIKLFKMKNTGVPTPETWLSKKLTPDSKVGFDPQTLSLSGFRNLNQALEKRGIRMVETPDLFEKIWENRPGISKNKVFELDENYTGLSRKEKRELVLGELKKMNADLQVITALDELAWMFNLRGSDIPFNPVFTGFGVVGKKEWLLFLDKTKLFKELGFQLESEKIERLDYRDFSTWLKSNRGKKVLTDPSSVNFAVYSSLRDENEMVENTSVIAMLKSQKNETELNGIREAMKKDGAAVLEFLYWLKENLSKEEITEYTAGKKLAEFRARQKDFTGESFAPIMGYNEHGAIIHWSARPEDALVFKPEGILLFDSGGQYLQGTTDITRTIALGNVSPQQKVDFTLVLKGMIGLTMAKFPEGTKGCHLDILARKALWENGFNYGHGTGHGVGHFLNVHEGPVSIRPDLNETTLRPGMVLSNEPGIYREGKYGIRIENMMVCVEKEQTEFGNFLGFETLSLCPVDTKLIDFSLLDSRELEWLNQYHQRVRNELKPFVDNHLMSFLDELTEVVKVPVN